MLFTDKQPNLQYNCAVVMGTYNRAHLLKKSLVHYYRTMKEDTCLIVFDDASTDYTEQVVRDWAELMDIHYFRLEKPPGTWRDSAQFLNEGISYALYGLHCETVFATHPEIMPGSRTLESARGTCALYPVPLWVSCKGYYLTQGQQAYMQDAWHDLKMGHDILNVRNVPGFYDEPGTPIEGPAADYVHSAMDGHAVWHSWIWGGGTRKTWEALGGMNESPVWGVVDVDLLNRRTALGIPTITPDSEHTMVIHQNHDDPAKNTVTPRDMDAVFQNLPRRTPENSQLNNLNPERWATR